MTETFQIDITQEEGYNKICNHLGIEKFEYELLQHENLLVEGECDKKYIQKLSEYFNITTPNIEVLNSADNVLKYLDFYDSYYKNNDMSSKPKVKVVFDNDPKGREMFNNICPVRTVFFTRNNRTLDGHVHKIGYEYRIVI